LSDTQKQQFVSLLDEFADVFVKKPGPCSIGMHEIHLTPDLSLKG